MEGFWRYKLYYYFVGISITFALYREAQEDSDSNEEDSGEEAKGEEEVKDAPKQPEETEFQRR